jgi:hypothetical protein
MASAGTCTRSAQAGDNLDNRDVGWTVVARSPRLDLAESGSCGLCHLSDNSGVETAAAAVILHSDEVGDLGRETVNGA